MFTYKPRKQTYVIDLKFAVFIASLTWCLDGVDEYCLYMVYNLKYLSCNLETKTTLDFIHAVLCLKVFLSFLKANKAIINI